MKNGIPCNDYYHTPKARKNQIIYRFVSDDNTTPASCSVRIGDEDPITGEAITNVDFFTQYYRLVDHQIYIQNKEVKDLLYLDGIKNDENKNKPDKKRILSIPVTDPFDDDPDDVLQLREFAASLTGRLADVYEALLIQHAGGKEKISMTSLAQKWGVSVTQICKDRDKIIKMIKDRIGSHI